MEQTVTERRFYDEQQVRQPKTWQNRAMDRSDTHFRQEPSQNEDFRRWTGWERTDMPYGSVNGEDIKFQSDHSYRRPLYLHSEVTQQREYNDGDSIRRPVSEEYRSLSTCHSFQTGRCFPESTSRSFHSEFTNSEKPKLDWNEEQHHEIGAGSRNLGSREGNVDNNFRTSQFQHWHPVDEYNQDWSAEHHPRIAGTSSNYGFCDGPSVISSREHVIVSPHGNMRLESVPGVPRNRPPCPYIPRGSFCQGEPSVTGPPITVYERTKYDLAAQHRQGAAPTSTNLRFDRGNVLGEAYHHEVHPCQAVHVGNVPLSQGSCSRSSFRPEVVGTCMTPINKQHKAIATSGNRPRRGSDSIVIVPNEQGKLVRHGMQLNKCFRGSPRLVTSIVSKKNDVESPTNALKCNHADGLSETFVANCLTVGISEASAIIQEPVDSKLTSSCEKVHISPANTTAVALEKNEMSNGNVDLSHEVNEKSDETKHILNSTTVLSEKHARAGVTIGLNCEVNEKPEETEHVTTISSRKKKSRVKKKKIKCQSESSKCGVEPITEVLSEKDTRAGITIDLHCEVNEKPEETEHVATISSRKKKKRVKKKRKCQPESSKCGLESITEKVTDTSSRRSSVSSMGMSSLDHDNVVPVLGVTGDICNNVPKTGVHGAAGVNIDLNHEVNDKPEKLPKRMKMKLRRLALKSMIGTSLNHDNATSTSGVIDVVSTSVPQNDIIRLVQANDHPLESNFTSACEEYHISSVNTTMDTLEMNETAGVNVGLSHEVNEKSVETKDQIAGVTIDLNCNVNGKIEETKDMVKAKSKKRKRKNLSSSSKCGVNSMKEEVTDTSSRRSPIVSMVGTSLDHGSILSVDVCTSISTTNVHKAVLANDHPVETDLTAEVNADLNHDVNEKPEETTHLQNDILAALERDEMVGVNIDRSHEINENPEETKHVVKVKSKNRKCKNLSSSVNSMKEEGTDTLPRRLPNGSTGGTSLEHASNLSAGISTSIPITGVHRAVLANGHPVESDLTSAVNVGLNHDVNGKSEETKPIVKATSKKRKRKNLSSPSKCGVNSMIEEVTDTSSQRLPSGSIGGTSLEHESILSVDISTSIPRTGVHRAVLANGYPVESDLTDGVNVDLNHDIKGKAEEAKHIVKAKSKKRKRKNLSSSSKCGVNSMTKEVTDASSRRLPMGSMGGTSLDHESILSASQRSEIAFLKSRRKLLVLDLNGLLADITSDYPKRLKPDFKLSSGKGVFIRPFYDDFLQFCFEKFDVGVWSSRAKRNVSAVVDLLMKNTKEKLLFCWNNSQCTGTGYKTIENKEKPLVLKELKKLWEKKEKNLPWKKGFYNESNTILLDDSPYKALRNPPHTAVYPFPYSFKDVHDKSLGPDGDLRLYLERLSEAENVQNFIRANPFGQKSITKADVSWKFYSKIAENCAKQEEKGIASGSFSSGRYHHYRR